MVTWSHGHMHRDSTWRRYLVSCDYSHAHKKAADALRERASSHYSEHGSSSHDRALTATIKYHGIAIIMDACFDTCTHDHLCLQEGLCGCGDAGPEKMMLEESIKRVRASVELLKRQDRAKEDVANGDRMFQDGQVRALVHMRVYGCRHNLYMHVDVTRL